MRSRRKIQHIQHVLQGILQEADFSGIRILHNCIPGTSGDADLRCEVAGFSLALPFFFNALTGGAPETGEINRQLARICRHFKIPMAVGSQKAALEDFKLAKTYRVAREAYPGGLIFANLSAGCTLDEARQAVEMLEADALQLHLNAPQEVMMPEGDRDFEAWLDNIQTIASRLEVPVMVKETGFGMAAEQVEILASTGIRAVDVSGKGGTNFIAVEAARAGRDAGELAGWGIPTPLALLEALEGAGALDVMVSGGVNTPLSMIKSLALGARAVGLAALPLRLVLTEGPDRAVAALEEITADLRRCMTLLGAARVPDLRKVPLVILGETGEWMRARGFQPEKYARRDFRQLSCKG